MTKKAAPQPRTAFKNLARHRAPSLKPREPSTDRDKKFCERWLVHHDHNKAYLEAGFVPTRSGGGLKKLAQYRKYLERNLPRVEIQVAKQIAYERVDILAAIANVGYANVLDYIEPFETVDPETQMLHQHWTLKPLHKLTREQAAAIDEVHYDSVTGRLGYTLPSAKTRLSALTTLGEQAANFKKKGGDIHAHLHLGENIPMEEILAAKAMLAKLVGPEVVREVLGWSESDQEQAG